LERERARVETEMEGLRERLGNVRKLCSQKERKLQEYIAITQITNDVEGKKAD